MTTALDHSHAHGDGFPSFPALIFRRVRAPEDFAAMAEVITRSREADGVEVPKSREEVAADFELPADFDPASDILVAEAGGRIVGLARTWRGRRAEGTVAIEHTVELLPDWRGRGVRELLLGYNERHARDLAARETGPGPCVLVLWANDDPNEWKDLVLSRGYAPVQHEIDLVRSLHDVPSFPLPEGVEARPVAPEDVQAIWDANREAWRGTWDYSEERWDAAHLEAFRHSPEFQPDLWQIAWDGGTVVGTVLGYILPEENARYGRRRGHTENVWVREGYRGRGIARALLARAMRALRDRGMDEATLGMELENPHGPLRLYEGMGFRIVKHFTWFEKAL